MSCIVLITMQLLECLEAVFLVAWPVQNIGPEYPHPTSHDVVVFELFEDDQTGPKLGTQQLSVLRAFAHSRVLSIHRGKYGSDPFVTEFGQNRALSVQKEFGIPDHGQILWTPVYHCVFHQSSDIIRSGKDKFCIIRMYFAFRSRALYSLMKVDHVETRRFV